jgi:glycine cleavage system aminomethyltransferase T
LAELFLPTQADLDLLTASTQAQNK